MFAVCVADALVSDSEASLTAIGSVLLTCIAAPLAELSVVSFHLFRIPPSVLINS